MSARIDAWIEAVARAIVASGLRHLPSEHGDRYREECDADVTLLRDTPARMLLHALATAACARRLMRTLGAHRPGRPDPLHRRVLAHLGFPVRLSEPRPNADVSYVFGGVMRWRPDAEGQAASAGDPLP